VKIPRWFAIIPLVGAILLPALWSTTALANSLPPDPRFVPGGGGGSIILNSPTDPNFQFSFTKNGTVGTVDCGAFDPNLSDSGLECINPAQTSFINDSGQTWVSLTLSFPTFSPSTLTFTPFENEFDPYFTTATSGVTGGVPFVTFSGTNATHPGIQSATSCIEDSCSGPPPLSSGASSFDFYILADVTDMADGNSFSAQGSATVATPEPATIFLLAPILAFLWLLRRVRWIPGLSVRL
jgi:hypothetical protein